jgi:hypothetical protein
MCRFSFTQSSHQNRICHLIIMPKTTKPRSSRAPRANTTTTTLAVASSSADALISGRIVNATKKGYQSNLRKIEEFYTQHNFNFVLPLL